MPELPEVETIVRGLARKMTGLIFSGGTIRPGKLIEATPEAMLNTLRGKKVLSIGRRGKHILFHLTDQWILVIHLGMTGKLQFLPHPNRQEKHTHAIFEFQNHPWELHFIDPRKFGRIRFLRVSCKEHLEGHLRLGPEALEISSEALIHRIRKKRKRIKALLLDQHFLAGLGNIYIDEILHAAGIHPLKIACTLSRKALLLLHGQMRRILKRAIQSKGTSVRNYRDEAGSPGKFQKKLKVYGREGKPCRSCRSLILRKVIAGRSTFFCPCCQPERNFRSK